MIGKGKSSMDTTEIKDMVRARYGAIAVAASDSGCCAPVTPGCCGTSATPAVDEKAKRSGYSAAELAAVPEGANLGLGCGNPQAIAAMQPGEVVVDLGSGAGFDCLLAARQVGPDGRGVGGGMRAQRAEKGGGKTA